MPTDMPYDPFGEFEYPADPRPYADRFPCVRSGYCCKVRPCPYGEVKSPTDNSCAFLEVDKEIAPGITQYRCGRYAWIVENVPEVHRRWSPAFGAGCSSPLFNTDRNTVIKELSKHEQPHHPDRRTIHPIRD